MNATIRVLLADDHILVRAGIRGLVEALPRVEVVGEAGDGFEVLRLAEEMRPDIVLLDIGMPGLNGLEALPRLLALDATLRVMILSMHTSEEYVLQALRGGAVGYLLKSAAVAELEIALRAIAQGETYLSPAVSKRVVDDYVGRTSGTATVALTPRQRKILQLVAQGSTSKEIAQELGVSYRTVEAHRAQLMERLNVHDVAGLVRFAVRMGVITSEE